jgi:rubrerythrin
MSDLKSYLTDDLIFCAPGLESGHPLGAILDRALDQYGGSAPSTPVPEILWGPERYGLERSPVFLSLDSDSKDEVLRKISRWNLSVSLHIEKSGHSFAAKMALLAERMEEKSLYCLISAEEAIHLRLFENFIRFEPAPVTDCHPMLAPLARVIRDGSREACLLMVQVLLEGFGMGHYRSLMEDCRDPALVQVFQRILRDEARHHGAGLVLAKESKSRGEERDEVFESAREVIAALQSADWVLRALEEAAGPLSRGERQKHLEAVGQRKVLEERLRSAREMLLKAERDQLVNRLEREGVFRVREAG